MKIDFELLEEELKKIEGIPGKILFLEKHIFKCKDKEEKKKLIKMLKDIEHLQKKKKSFEELHNAPPVSSESIRGLDEIVKSQEQQIISELPEEKNQELLQENLNLSLNDKYLQSSHHRESRHSLDGK